MARGSDEHGTNYATRHRDSDVVDHKAVTEQLSGVSDRWYSGNKEAITAVADTAVMLERIDPSRGTEYVQRAIENEEPSKDDPAKLTHDLRSQLMRPEEKAGIDARIDQAVMELSGESTTVWDVIQVRLETNHVMDPIQFEDRDHDFSVNPRTLGENIKSQMAAQGHDLNPAYALATALSNGDLEAGQQAWSNIHDLERQVQNVDRDLNFGPGRLQELRESPEKAEEAARELLNRTETTKDVMTFQLLNCHDQNMRPGGDPELGLQCLALAEVRDRQVEQASPERAAEYLAQQAADYEHYHRLDSERIAGL